MNNEVAKLTQANAPAVFNFFDNNQFATMQRICQMFAASNLVPDMYRATADNPANVAIANCMIAVEMAQRIGASPLMVMQNLVIIYGRPSWSSKFLIGTVNTCGRFAALKYRFTNKGKLGKISYNGYKWNGQKNVAAVLEFDGTNIDNIECVAYTYELTDDAKTELAASPVSIEMAVKEGWYTKAGSKWPNMPQKMLIYRAASFWTNEYAPELSMGMKTDDETNDITDIPFEEIKGKVDGANKENLTFDKTTPAAEPAAEQPGVQSADDVKPANEIKEDKNPI